MVDLDYVIVGAGAVGCVLANGFLRTRTTRCSCWSTAAGTRTQCSRAL